MPVAGLLLAAYLLGSFPTSYLVVHWHSGRDIRSMGTGNPGAMNVLDSVGLGPAAVVALVDILKGMAAVGLAYAFGLGDVAAVLAAFAAVVGHDYSIFLRLSGGNGTATGLGAATMLMPVPAVIATVLGVSIGLAISNRRIGGLLAMVSFPVAATILDAPETRLYGGIALILLAVAQIIYDEGFHLSAVRTRPRR
ncbi:MAG: glycerol-3-phosphate acyltransferase [Dehalococcoidia bacterium]|nr:glycerol-3-phosphate acyltransferase [Dehalococcoidia bacterium]